MQVTAEKKVHISTTFTDFTLSRDAWIRHSNCSAFAQKFICVVASSPINWNLSLLWKTIEQLIRFRDLRCFYGNKTQPFALPKCWSRACHVRIVYVDPATFALTTTLTLLTSLGENGSDAFWKFIFLHFIDRTFTKDVYNVTGKVIVMFSHVSAMWQGVRSFWELFYFLTEEELAACSR